MKKLALCLFLSATAQAAEIDDLVTTSQSIRETFDGGIRAIGGMMNYANDGGIAPTGVTSPYLISTDQADAYNDALNNVQNASYTYDPGAQEYFDNQASGAMQDMSNAIDVYVQAASAVIAVVQINNMASEATTEQEAAQLQAYISDNNVYLSSAEVSIYNESLTAVEETAQTAAAFMAVANDPQLIDSANNQAAQVMASFSEAGDAFFDSGVVSVDFASYSMTVSLDVSSYFKTSVEILTAGEQSSFYTTGPTANPCFFKQDPVEREECVAANGI